MSQSFSPRRTKGAFTLVEFALILFILIVVGVVLYPVFQKASARSGRSPAINQKQLGLAFLQYIQDYDEKFPPVVSWIKVPVDGTNESQNVMRSWVPTRWRADGTALRGLLAPYEKRGVSKSQIFIEPRYQTGDLHYMYNDLLAEQSQAKLTGVAQTILTCDSENFYINAGHAWTPDEYPVDAEPNAEGLCPPGRGATVRSAPQCQYGGAHYAFADGHVKWYKATYDRERGVSRTIYFPPRSSNSPSHKGFKDAPEPGGKMGDYAGTFHLR